MTDPFASEAAMVDSWLRHEFAYANYKGRWLVYPETAGWDLLLAHEDGYQIGIEAKLSLNAKVLDQALIGQHNEWRQTGPDYRAVLVPDGKVQHYLGHIAAAIGIHILTVEVPVPGGGRRYIGLPDEASNYHAWPNWLPERRCELPEYIPDVAAGCAAPVQLTTWKVKAIKLMIVLERRGFVTRGDMRALQISPTRWTDHYHGFLARTDQGYVISDTTPDLRAQHPTNYVQIEADFATWSEAAGIAI